MKTIFRILPTLLMFSGSVSMLAQNEQCKISGVVVGADSLALPWTSVFVTDTAQHIISSSMCDENGRFQLNVKKGNYIFGASNVGYDLIARPIIINGDTALGSILLEESANELQTVVVNGRITRVRPQRDGFSVDVTGLNANYNDAFDLLHCIPQLTFKGTDIGVMGKKNIIIQIGKVVQRVDASELASVLKGYDAKLIERVEVLKQPPLRYDRDGNTAMIILHTSSAFEKYFGGIIGSELMKGTHHNYRYGGYATAMYNGSNLFFEVSPSYNKNGSYTREDVNYDHGESLYNMLTPSQGDNSYRGVRSTLQWNYSAKGMAGITGTVNKRGVDNEFLSYERTIPQGTGCIDADNNNNISFDTPKRSVTAYMEQNFGRHNNKVWLEASYYNYKTTEFAEFIGTRTSDSVQYFTYKDDDLLKVNGVGVNNDYSLKLDAAGDYTLDFGLKYLQSRTRKKRSHEQWMEGESDETYRQTDDFRLDELCFAPYVSATMQFSPKLWGRIGIISDVTSRRHRQSDGWTPYMSFVSWLPSLHTTFRLSHAYQLSATFNSSVAQPKFSQLNPFTWRISQRVWRMGNTELSPEKHYKTRIGLTYRGNLQVAGTLDFGRDIISDVTTINADGAIITQPENAQNSRLCGLEMAYWYDKISWLTASVSANWAKSRYTSDNPLLADKMTGWEWGAEGYLEFVFNRERTFTGYVSGNYSGKKKTTVSTIDPQYSVDVGLTYFLFSRRLSVSIAGLGLISSAYKGHSERDGYAITFNNRYNFPTLYFSVSYKFYNANDKSVRKRMSANEVEDRF